MSNLVIDSRYGKVIVSDKDRYVGKSVIKYGEFSESEVNIFRQLIKPGMIVVDVGANYGLHSLAFSSLVGTSGTVYAFEPQRQVFNALCGTMSLNNISNVWVSSLALGNGDTVKNAELDFNLENNFGGFSFPEIKEGEDLLTYKLGIPCHFLKIDVEGYELEVLKGAEDMIKENKPVMYIEADRPDKNKALFDFIRYLGYTPYWHAAEFYNTDNYFKDPENIFPGIASINVLCVSKEIAVSGMEEAFAEDWDKHFTSQKS